MVASALEQERCSFFAECRAASLQGSTCLSTDNRLENSQPASKMEILTCTQELQAEQFKVARQANW